MTILVTGAAGFVGLALCEALLARGDAVVALDSRPLPTVLPGRLRTIQADACDPAAMSAALECCDRLVVAAAITAGPARELAAPEPVVAVNVGAVCTAVRLAAAAGVRRVLHVSSVAAYGAGPDTPGPLREDGPAVPRSLYGITKLAGERAALRLADLAGLDLVSARLGACFGPFEHATGLRDTLSPQWQIVDAWRAGRRAVLDADAVRDWLYIRDAVAGLLALLDTPRLPHPVYNVGSGTPTALSEFCRALPGLDWGVGSDPNVQSWTARPPAAIGRLLADTGFRPRFTPAAAAADWLPA